MNSHLLPLFISYRSSEEKLIKYQAISSSVIMSVSLMTTLFNKVLILQGGIWCWSLLGLKGLKEAAGAVLPLFTTLLSLFSVLLSFVAAEPLVQPCRFSHVHRQQCCFFMINSFPLGPKQQNIPCSNKQSYLSSYLQQHGKLYVFWKGRKNTFQKKNILLYGNL